MDPEKLIEPMTGRQKRKKCTDTDRVVDMMLVAVSRISKIPAIRFLVVSWVFCTNNTIPFHRSN